MDDNAHRENGRPKQLPNQWMMQHHQPSMKQIMAIMAERDAAIQERNLAISEKKKALSERDMAILQRDSSIAERDNAIMERDNAISALHYRETNPNIKYTQPPIIEHYAEELPKQEVHQPASAAKPRKNNNKRAKEVIDQPNKKSKPSKKVKMVNFPNKPDWKERDLGLNQVPYDDTTMSVPGCSCTGVLRPCYKWGSGGWQSSCCTMTLSMYPLPTVPNKRHARVGGRKMSGSVFAKLLSRLASEGFDLSKPVDLKPHWAKHGTNRYITIK